MLQILSYLITENIVPVEFTLSNRKLSPQRLECRVGHCTIIFRDSSLEDKFRVKLQPPIINNSSEYQLVTWLPKSNEHGVG